MFLPSQLRVEYLHRGGRRRCRLWFPVRRSDDICAVEYALSHCSQCIFRRGNGPTAMSDDFSIGVGGNCVLQTEGDDDDGIR